jgi:predicted transcriptional regulator of viral defense system
MSSRANNADPSALKNLGIVSGRQIQKKFGISQPTLSRWVKSGEVLRLSHGLYVHPEYKIPPQDLDFVVACAKFGPKSAIGGLSALYHYNLTEQPPTQIWVIAPPNKADNNRLYRILRTKTPLKHGIDALELYRITNIERTVIEGLKFAVKIGPRVAINAARKALKEGLTSEKKLGEMAKNLKLQSVLEKYWEAIIE